MAKPLKNLDKTPNDEIEKRVMSIVGSMRIEGFEMRDELVNDVRGILTGELDADKEIARFLEQYKSKVAVKKTSSK